MRGLLFDTLDKLPEPWDMVAAWVVYTAIVGVGFAVVIWWLL